MFTSVLKNLLSAPELTQLHTMLQPGDFVDGHISGGNENKNNHELQPSAPGYLEILKLVEFAVRRSTDFNFTAFPRYLTRPIISRYQTGMFYDEHVDFPVVNFLGTQHLGANLPTHRALAPVGSNYVRADLSLTLFLSAPSTYDGGELCLSSPVGDQKYKLEAGSAVLYPTGELHSVSRVTRGERLAAIFWVQSLVPIEARRRALHEAFALRQALAADTPESKFLAQADMNFNNLFRIFAET